MTQIEYDKKTLVIIPAYNVERSIGGVIEDVRAKVSRAMILVVNDGSTDLTPEKQETAVQRFWISHLILEIEGATQGYQYPLNFFSVLCMMA